MLLNLQGLVSQLYDIASSIGSIGVLKQEQKKRKIEQEATTPDQVKSTLLEVLMDSTAILSVPYGSCGAETLSPFSVCAFRFAELLPDITKEKFPKRIVHLISVWGRPEETEHRTVHDLQTEIGFLIDMIDKSEKELLKQVVLCVESNLLSLDSGHLSFKRTFMSIDKDVDTLTHECNLDLIENKVYETVKSCSDSVCKIMNALFSTQNFKSSGEPGFFRKADPSRSLNLLVPLRSSNEADQ